MIKFFRKIRYELLGENKTGKYLKYAIGEIVLVVIGILIALSINNWNNHRLEENEINNILHTIVSNLKSDISALDFEIKDGTQRMKYWERLLSDSDNDSLASQFVKNITIRFIPLDDAGYSNALANNKLRLVKSSSIKSGIVSYYGIDLDNSSRFSRYLLDLANDLTLVAIEESILVKNEKTFGKRMSVVLKDPSIIEMTNSYMRLYTIILDALKERKTTAQNLLEDIESELIR
jgi:hypothetical protein